jgi:RNA polymerase sigma-70 factor (ECF subfamily)
MAIDQSFCWAGEGRQRRVVDADTDQSAKWAGSAELLVIAGERGGWEDAVVTTNLIARSQAGDELAFGQLIDPYRRELLVHCYRILGSVQDAEDALQETLLAAWRGLGAFEGRASIRTWLYRVATSRCLIVLRSARRRPQTDWPPTGLDLPEPTRLGDVAWLEPAPDALLAGLADTSPGPDARYEAMETISLAFITALQQLSPRQRAVLVLRDVLGFHASEVARILETTDESVTSALKRARATLARRSGPSGQREQPPLPGSTAEQVLVDRLTRAYQTGDVDSLVALLADDVLMTMPPIPLEYEGRELVARFLTAAVFRPGTAFRLVATRANGQPAFGVYMRDVPATIAGANGLLVFTFAGNLISAITRFDVGVLPRFGLPGHLRSGEF